MTKKLASNDEILTHHLHYEIGMLGATYTALSTGFFGTLINNALIESFCIHARALIEFFENKQGGGASRFTGGTYSAAHLGSLDGIKKKLNTQIAHLTDLRTTDPDEKIGSSDRETLFKALLAEAGNFADQLAPNFKGKFTPP